MLLTDIERRLLFEKLSPDDEKQLLSMLPCPREDARVHQGVLLSDEIQHCVDAFRLIIGFEAGGLKPASYKLRIGNEYAVGGIPATLTGAAGEEIVIPPFQVAVIKTYEIINLPLFLIARWNIQVSRAYQGLMWIGGPQVDPGWVGHLFCPIYNLSDKDVRLRFKDPIAVIDFVHTTVVTSRSKAYPRPPDRVGLKNYPSLNSGHVAHVQARIESFEQKLGALEHRLEARTGEFRAQVTAATVFLLTLLGVLTAGLAVVAAGNQASAPFWSVVTMIISVAAAALSLAAMYFARRR